MGLVACGIAAKDKGEAFWRATPRVGVSRDARQSLVGGASAGLRRGLVACGIAAKAKGEAFWRANPRAGVARTDAYLESFAELF